MGCFRSVVDRDATGYSVLSALIALNGVAFYVSAPQRCTSAKSACILESMVPAECNVRAQCPPQVP